MCLLVLVVLLIVHACVARHHHLHAHPHVDEVTSRTNDNSIVNVADRISVVDAATGISYNPYSKNHPGRHVCTNQKEVMVPIKTKQSFCKPTYKKYQQRCNDNQLCSGVRVVYETSYRDVVVTKQSKHLTYACCPGWKQANNRSNGCNKPLCSDTCQNGGSCIKPDSCTCVLGFSGRSCEFDLDECKEQKPCDQICINTKGSYSCKCRENFTLQSDGQSCKKDDDDGPGVEAKELEYDTLDQRILKLETIIGETDKSVRTRTEIKEMKNDLDSINKDVGMLKSKVNEVESYKTDLNFFKTKLHLIEKKSSKIDELSARYDKMKKCAFYNKICI